MSDQIATVTTLQLDENESARLARLVQMLMLELGFAPEDVRRSYRESLAYFME